MYKILALPVIDVSTKALKYGNQSSSTANLSPELFLAEI